MRTVILIPARYNSSRFPGKPLVQLLGKPMIVWVAELSSRAVGVKNVYVVTDDIRIATVVESAGYQAIIIEYDALTGTDRIAQVAESIEADIYINVQGDEPLVEPVDILKIRDEKLLNMEYIINGFSWIEEEEALSVNIPKVITNESNLLVYMSRTLLPSFKDAVNKPKLYKKQVCIYAFTGEELKLFNQFARKSELEISEDIEILRFLELNKGVHMVELQANSLAVDVPDDVIKVESALKAKLMSDATG